MRVIVFRSRLREGALAEYGPRVERIASLAQQMHGFVASKDYVAPRFHMFYGFVAFLTVGLAFQYRASMRGRLEMFYGLAGLFLMGLGIRAVMQVT